MKAFLKVISPGNALGLCHPLTKSAWRAVPWMVAIALCLSMCSCGSTKVVTQTVRDVRVDTVYLSNVQYDSIFIYKDRVSEHHLGTLPPVNSKGEYLEAPMRTDTLYIKDVSIEYRYKMLRDTVKVIQRDSIPYEVTIVQTKEIARPLTWYDHLTRSVFWVVIGVLFVLFVRLVFNLKKRFTL